MQTHWELKHRGPFPEADSTFLEMSAFSLLDRTTEPLILFLPGLSYLSGQM